MERKTRQKGFSLIELMTVVAIVAVLVALALPSYTKYVRKANRGEAQQLLLNWANNQEIWRANDTDYASSADIDVPDGTTPKKTKYNFFVRQTASEPPVAGDCANAAPSATEYALVACATGDQVNDEERGSSCTRLSINQANTKSPANCW